MKKINSIHYGYKFLLTGIIIMFVIPGMLKLINIIIEQPLIDIIVWCVFGIGALITLGFIVMLMIELHQDSRINRYYSTHKNIKIRFNNAYECSACGNRNVRENDTVCNVCGVKFSNEEDKTIEEILHKNNCQR